MEECCCLCRCLLSSGQAKKRRKKLHGAACNTSRKVLSDLVTRQLDQNLENFVETEGHHSFLCKECDAKLHSVSLLEGQLTQIKNEIGTHISAFHPISIRSRPPVPGAGVKRTMPLPEILSKHPRLDPQTQPEHPHASTLTKGSPDISVSKNNVHLYTYDIKVCSMNMFFCYRSRFTMLLGL